MVRLLRFLIFGRTHFHFDKLIRTIERGSQDGYRIRFTEFVCQCEGCGRVKTYRTVR